MRHFMASFQTSQLQCAMNELSNHDHSRFLTRTNGTAGRVETHGSEAADYGVNFGIFREAVVVQMTWPGAPTVYYGDEGQACVDSPILITAEPIHGEKKMWCLWIFTGI